jgi:hypothetical protein
MMKYICPGHERNKDMLKELKTECILDKIIKLSGINMSVVYKETVRKTVTNHTDQRTWEDFEETAGPVRLEWVNQWLNTFTGL